MHTREIHLRAFEEIRSNRLEPSAWSLALRACRGDVVRARDEYVLRRVEDLERGDVMNRPFLVLVAREVACVAAAVALLTAAFVVVRFGLSLAGG